ncbi:uncharacterized protein J3R85_003225 [Psidium guajava]|nr:uncharacterized protein J3R85_003225 [Psidium guajava]
MRATFMLTTSCIKRDGDGSSRDIFAISLFSSQFAKLVLAILDRLAFYG